MNIFSIIGLYQKFQSFSVKWYNDKYKPIYYAKIIYFM